MIAAQVMPFGANSGVAASIWLASSRVGARTRTLIPICFFAGIQFVKDRQHKSRRLTGAGLGRGDDVAAFEYYRNSLLLYGCRLSDNPIARIFPSKTAASPDL